MLSVGLCLSARLPTGLLVFFGFVSSFGSIDHRLQQFELLPCGAVQTVDFFDHIVGVGGCDPFSEFVPSLFRFGVMYHHFNGALFRMAHSPPITSLSPHFYGLLVVRYSLRFPLDALCVQKCPSADGAQSCQGGFIHLFCGLAVHLRTPFR